MIEVSITENQTQQRPQRSDKIRGGWNLVQASVKPEASPDIALHKTSSAPVVITGFAIQSMGILKCLRLRGILESSKLSETCLLQRRMGNGDT